jgi:glycine cleavage system H protein
MGVPEGLLYTKDHEWVKIEEDLVTIGITFYAQSHLGDITYLDLPKPGDIFRQFDKIVIIESVKTIVEIHSPLSGKVARINETLAGSPEVINQSPYDKGWLLVLEISNIDEKNNLMSAEEYDKFLEGID